MMTTLAVRDLRADEHQQLGALMVEVYSQLDGFPGPDEQPRYYAMLANIGDFARRKDARVLVARTEAGELAGGVVYFGDMREYGSGGTATRETGASGMRLLAVAPRFRGTGVGKALANACIDLAREKGHSQVVLHTTEAMKIAWAMYRKLGFERAADLDFMQESLRVYGFRLRLGDRVKGGGDQPPSTPKPTAAR